MPVLNRIADYAPELTEWRRALHRRPELKFACHDTARFVVERLREMGVDEIHEGIAESGVVALIRGQGKGPVIGLRADMDALPMEEETGLEHASQTPGAMHACGHDGHTVMLLGAARYLAETRNFAGTVALIFQPAEEHGGGANVMVQEGILDRFSVDEVYGLHNRPGAAVGAFETAAGPIMAAVSTFDIHIEGKGGHAAYPEDTVDPIVAAVAMVNGIQTISSRNANSFDDLVISVTQIHAGSADNVVPGSAYINGTVRTFDRGVQDMVERRLRAVVDGTSAAYDVLADFAFHVEYPATVNDADRAAFAAGVAREVGVSVVDDVRPEMGAEDFAYMLNERPGAYLFLGNGDSAGLHHPEYDFNDETAPYGASFFARLVERRAPLA